MISLFLWLTVCITILGIYSICKYDPIEERLWSKFRSLKYIKDENELAKRRAEFESLMMEYKEFCMKRKPDKKWINAGRHPLYSDYE